MVTPRVMAQTLRFPKPRTDGFALAAQPFSRRGGQVVTGLAVRAVLSAARERPVAVYRMSRNRADGATHPPQPPVPVEPRVERSGDHHAGGVSPPAAAPLADNAGRALRPVKGRAASRRDGPQDHP